MRVRTQSPSGDYTFGQSLLNFYIDEPQGVGQTVQTRLLLWLGEWYLDTTQGTPYLEGIFGKHSQAEADATIQNQVLQTDGVTGIENYESALDPNTRALSVSFTLNTIYGQTDVQMANYLNY